MSVKQGRFLVGTEEVPDLARTNSKAAIVFFEALKSVDVQLEIYVERKHFEECTREVDKAGSSRFLHVDVHISGRKSDSESMGALLSKHGIYLQDPRHSIVSMEYCNPHILTVDASEIEVWFQEIELNKSQITDVTKWNVALDNLPQQRHLNATAVGLDDTVVVTPMMP